jgi:O-antigen/teichoic acid export membrane protein
MNAAPSVTRVLRTVREQLGPLWWYAALLFFVSKIGDLVNFYTNMIVVPRFRSAGLLSLNDLGVIEPVTRLVGFSAVPLAIVSIVGAKYLSAYHAAGEDGKVKRFSRDMLVWAAASFVIFLLALRALYAPLCVRLNLHTPHLFAGLAAMAALSCFGPVVGVMLQGLQRFRASALISFADPALRLAAALLLIPLFHVSGYLFAMCAGGLAAVVIGAGGLRGSLGRRVRSESYSADWPAIRRFALPVGIWTIAGVFQGFIEPFVIKHFLPVEDAAGYYGACRIGAIPGYFVGSVNYVLLPLLSFRHERGEDTGAYTKQALLFTAAVGAVGTAVLGLLAGWLFGLLPDWQPFVPYAPQVWKVSAITLLSSMFAVYTTHEIACRRLRFLGYLVPIILAEAVVLYGLFGWTAFAGFLPAAVADLLRSLPRSIDAVIWLMVASRVALLLCAFGDQYRRRRAAPHGG